MKRFTVLTMNFWGLPFGISSDKFKRLEALGEGILKSKYDIVCLQEVWCKSDYKMLKKILINSHPHHHYFHCGITGSGLCIFSMWPIEDAFYYQFPVNGFFHMVHHGDWFGGKGVGMARLNINGLLVNVYNTHLHADYSGKGVKDSYFAHRLLQAFDTALFVKHTGESANVSILAGDLNVVDDDPCCKLICGLGELQDAWEVADRKEPVPETNDCIRNAYRNKSLPNIFPGTRIDFILFKAVDSVSVSVAECLFPFPDRIPGTNISYSDHEAVVATFICSSQAEGTKRIKLHQLKTEPLNSLHRNLVIGLDTCRTQIQIHNRDIFLFQIIIILLLCGLIFINLLLVDHHIIKKLCFLCLSIIICFFVALVFTRWQDRSWFKNAKKRFKLCLTAMENLT